MDLVVSWACSDPSSSDLVRSESSRSMSSESLKFRRWIKNGGTSHKVFWVHSFLEGFVWNRKFPHKIPHKQKKLPSSDKTKIPGHLCETCLKLRNSTQDLGGSDDDYWFWEDDYGFELMIMDLRVSSAGWTRLDIRDSDPSFSDLVDREIQIVTKAVCFLLFWSISLLALVAALVSGQAPGF